MFQVHTIVTNVAILIDNVRLRFTDILSVNRICQENLANECNILRSVDQK